VKVEMRGYFGSVISRAMKKKKYWQGAYEDAEEDEVKDEEYSMQVVFRVRACRPFLRRRLPMS